jgi:hypothetical protein
MRRTLVLLLIESAIAGCRAGLVVIGTLAFMQVVGLRLCIVR